MQEQLNAKYCKCHGSLGLIYKVLFILDTTNSIFIALAVGDPHAMVPYQQLRPEHIIGLPPGVNLCHPSNLSNDQLETIYNNIAHIKFIGKFSMHCHSRPD